MIRYRFALLTSLLWFALFVAQAQVTPSANQNYVVTQMPRDPLTAVSLSSPVATVPATVMYIDGLGRPLQSVQVRGSADAGSDIVTGATVYDAFGRPQQTYLPAPGGLGGTVNTAATIQAAGAALYGDVNPFGETVYDPTPLNRMRKQWGPGVAWRTANRATNVTYGVAPANTVLRFKVNFYGNALYANVEGNGGAWDYFGATDIATQTTTDEQGNQTVAYLDLQGRTLRRDVKNGNQTLTTLYVYDQHERLTAIIPPKLYDWFIGAGPGTPLYFYLNGDANTPNPVFKEGAYIYRYDLRGRTIRKHVPGAGWTDMVYDRQDRPVMSRDEQDKAEGYWQYTRYDGLSRVVQTGRLALTRTADDLRADFATASVTNDDFPTTVAPPEAALLTENQYDNYSGVPLNYNASGAFDAPFGTASGLLTRSRVRNLATNAWYETALWYDDKGRPLQQQSQTVRGGTDRTDRQYRFNGEVLQVRTQREGLTELTTYQYDHLGRKTSTDHQLNGGAVQRLATYRYDAIGRLQQKGLGGSVATVVNSGQSGFWTAPGTWQGGAVPGAGAVVGIGPGQTVTLPGGATQQATQLRLAGRLATPATSRLRLSGGGAALQVVDYSWHIRGGLLGLNLAGGGALQTGKLFAMGLGYEADGTYYDGNIRSQSWRTAGDGQERSYTYSYDGLSRLTGASGSGAGVVSVTGMSHDANGNLQHMDRAGVDNLSYRYAANSNKLLAVSDATNNTAGFADGNTNGDDYAYDAAGSLTKDLNKGITAIAYNYLKLPRQISFSSGQVVSYQYDAAGVKLKKTVTGGGTTITTEYVGNQVWQNGALLQVAHEEGRYTPGGGYEWSLSDHLGNLRVSFVNANGAAQLVQSQHYDPWGWELPGVGTSGSGANKYKFLNRESQAETGYVDLLARQYDPLRGRFDGVDPAPEGQEHLSLYQYGWNNPVLRSDPNGKCPDCDDPFLFARLATTAFYDAKHAIANTYFRAVNSDRRATYKEVDGQQVFETQYYQRAPDNTLAGTAKELLSAGLDIAAVYSAGATGGSPTGGVFAKSGGGNQTVKAAQNALEEVAETTKLRHYTSNQGLEGIQKDMTIKAYDQNTVFADKARGKALSASDAGAKFGIAKKDARNYVEFSVESSRISVSKNAITGAIEYKVRGEIKLDETAKFFKRN